MANSDDHEFRIHKLEMDLAKALRHFKAAEKRIDALETTVKKLSSTTAMKR